MSQVVQSAEGLSGLFGSFSSILNKFFDWITESDIDIDEVEETKDKDGNVTGRKFTATTANGHKIHVKIVQASQRRGVFDMYCVADTGQQKQYPHIREDQFDKKLTDFIDEVYKEGWEDKSELEEDFDISETFDNVSSSTRVQIRASKDIETGQINIHQVFCNYDPTQAYEDVEDVITSDEFLNDDEIEIITDEPVCLEIVPSEADYEVAIIADIIPMNYVALVIQQQYITIFRLQQLMLTLPATSSFKRDVEYSIHTVQNQQHFLLNSALFEKASQESAKVDHEALTVFNMIKQLDLNLVPDYSDRESILEEYCTTLEFLQPNFPVEVQQLINEWLLTLRYTIQ